MPARPTPRRRTVFARLVGPLVAAIAIFVIVSVPGSAAAAESVPGSVASVPSVAAATSPSACVLPADGSGGQIEWDTFRRPIGVVRAVMLFVDFADVPAKGSAEHLF